jgi:hypothetical protein
MTRAAAILRPNRPDSASTLHRYEHMRHERRRRITSNTTGAKRKGGRGRGAASIPAEAAALRAAEGRGRGAAAHRAPAKAKTGPARRRARRHHDEMRESVLGHMALRRAGGRKREPDPALHETARSHAELDQPEELAEYQRE